MLHTFPSNQQLLKPYQTPHGKDNFVLYFELTNFFVFVSTLKSVFPAAETRNIIQSLDNLSKYFLVYEV